jgi:hypothetical protein
MIQTTKYLTGYGTQVLWIAMSVCSQRALAWGFRTSFEDPEPQVVYALVELLGEDTIAVMNQGSVFMV